MGSRHRNKRCRTAISWLVTFHFCSSILAAPSAEFETQLQQAETSYAKDHSPVDGPESWIIELSPKTRLANGIGDISTTGTAVARSWTLDLTAVPPTFSAGAGRCKGEVDSFCPTIEAGRRRVADCLQAQVAKQESGNVQGKVRCSLLSCSSLHSQACLHL